MTTQPKASERLEILKIADEIGVAKAAKIYSVSSRTIIRWKKKLQQGGINNLNNQSRSHKTTTKAISDDQKKLLINSREKQPLLKLGTLLKTEKINISLSSAYKILKEYRNNHDENILSSKIKHRTPLKELIFSMKKINTGKFDYLFMLEDLVTGVTFTGFADEYTYIHVAVFFDYVIQKLKLKEQKHCTIYASSSLVSNTVIHAVVCIKHGIQLLKKTEQKKSKFYKLPLIEDFKKLNDFIIACNAYQFKNNYEIITRLEYSKDNEQFIVEQLINAPVCYCQFTPDIIQQINSTALVPKQHIEQYFVQFIMQQ